METLSGFLQKKNKSFDYQTIYFDYQMMYNKITLIFKVQEEFMLENIKEVLVEVAGVNPDSVKLEADLKNDLDIDSLASVELCLELETKFDIEIDDDELNTLVTVNDIVKLIESKK
jgi:acyl carrier protein